MEKSQLHNHISITWKLCRVFTRQVKIEKKRKKLIDQRLAVRRFKCRKAFLSWRSCFLNRVTNFFNLSRTERWSTGKLGWSNASKFFAMASHTCPLSADFFLVSNSFETKTSLQNTTSCSFVHFITKQTLRWIIWNKKTIYWINNKHFKLRMIGLGSMYYMFIYFSII